MHYDLLLPSRVIFGWGRRRELGRWAGSLGRRAILVCGSRTLQRAGIVDGIVQDLGGAGVEVHCLGTAVREPSIADVDGLTRELLERGIGAGDVVIGIGGGAGLDLAKAVAAMATNSCGRSVREFLEGVGSGAAIDRPPLPTVVLPTTAGTGTEATKNAVISVDDPPCKKSLRSDRMVPAIALIDPQLTVSSPPHVTAASGMDAVTQLIESYISSRAQPVPQALAIDGLRKALPALPVAVSEPDNRPAREAMSHAAFLSGVALANSGLGMAHGVAAALGAHCGVGHGLACATMLPVALRVNREVSRERLAALGRGVLGVRSSTDDAAADAFVETIESLCRQLDIPSRLRDLGIGQDQIPALAEGAKGNSLSGNPRPLSTAELRDILQDHW